MPGPEGSQIQVLRSRETWVAWEGGSPVGFLVLEPSPPGVSFYLMVLAGA